MSPFSPGGQGRIGDAVPWNPNPHPGYEFYSTAGDNPDTYRYDGSRSKTLSINHDEITFTAAGIANGVYMDFGGITCEAGFGYLLQHDATLVSMSILELSTPGGTNNWRIVKNGGAIIQLGVTAKETHDNDLNTDLSSGDLLAGFFLNGTSSAKNSMIIRLRRRL